MAGKSYFDEEVPVIVIRSLFEKYDTNEDGKLSIEELSNLLDRDLGLSLDQSEAYKMLLDKDANGTISFSEFKDWITGGEKFKNINTNSRYQIMITAVELFKRYDVDESKGLDRNEFRKLHADYGGDPNYVNIAMDFLDKDHNDIISFYEFLKWLRWVDLGRM